MANKEVGKWKPKTKNKLGRHTKHVNKHKSSKKYRRQG